MPKKSVREVGKNASVVCAMLAMVEGYYSSPDADIHVIGEVVAHARQLMEDDLG
jgi:hypothetical protein